MTYEEIKERLKERGYNLLSEVYVNNKTPIIFEKDGYKYENSWNGIIKTDNPKKWGISNRFSFDNMKLYMSRNGNQLELIDFDGKTLTLKCACGNIFNVTRSNFITHMPNQCPKCGHMIGNKKHIKSDTLDKMIELGFEPLDCENIKSKEHYYFIDGNGYILKLSPYNVLTAGTNPYDTLFDVCNKYSINNMWLWISNNCPSIKLLSNEFIGAKEKYKFKCFCGNEFETNWQYFRNARQFRCSTCSNRQSMLELKTEDWLKENSIRYEKEKWFDDCRDKNPLPFDFWISSKNLLIEVDGQQHFDDRFFKGQLEYIQSHDRIKTEYCLKNNIRLLRISYKSYNGNKYKQILSDNIL